MIDGPSLKDCVTSLSEKNINPFRNMQLMKFISVKDHLERPFQ